MELWHYWMIAGIVLCILEMFTGDFVLLGLGIASAGSSFAAASDASVSIQLTVFALVSIAFIFGVRPVARRHFYKNSDPRPTNVQALIGRSATVIEPIGGNHNAGRVKLGSEEWRAVSIAPGTEIPGGATVKVNAVDGATLIVTTD